MMQIGIIEEHLQVPRNFVKVIISVHILYIFLKWFFSQKKQEKFFFCAIKF